MYQILLLIVVIINNVCCGPVAVFVKKTQDNITNPTYTTTTNPTYTNNPSKPQDLVIPQDQAIPLPGEPSSENKSSSLPENNIQRLVEASRSVSKFVSNTCQTLLKEEENKCLCEKQNVSDSNEKCNCSAKISNCQISNGTNICLCCTTKQCSSEAGSDSLPKDLEGFFGGNSWPAMPKFRFPNFFGEKSWPSFPMLPFPKLFGESSKLPKPSFPLFPKEVFPNLFKRPEPSMDIKNMFDDENVGTQAFKSVFEDDLKKGFLNSKNSTSWMKSETHNRECFQIKGNEKEKCSCTKKETTSPAPPTSSSTPPPPSCSCSAKTQSCIDEICFCCIDRKCKVEI